MKIHNRIHRYRLANRSWYRRNASQIKVLTIHHNAIPHDGRRTLDSTLDQMRNTHTGQGWPGLSYHYFIWTDGTIVQLNQHEDITWHDRVNNDSIGICLHGYFHQPHHNKPNDKQLASVQWLLDHLQNTLGDKQVVGHRDRSATACPGNTFYPWVKSYKKGAGNPKYMPKTHTQEEWQIERDERNKNWNLYQDTLKRVDELQSDLDGANTKATTRKKEYETLLENLAKKLTLPATSDISDIMGGVERLLSVEETLRQAEKELSKQKEKHDQEKEQFQKDIEALRVAIDKQQKENDTLLARIDDLEKRLEAREDAIKASSRFGLILEKLLRIFK